MRVDLLAVEGVHDIAFIQRILKVFGFSQQKLAKGIPTELSVLVPNRFPANPQGDLTKRVDLPHFHVKGEHWIVLLGAGGDSSVVEKVSSTLSALDDRQLEPSSISVFLDADNQIPEKQLSRRLKEWTKKVEDTGLALLGSYHFPKKLGISVSGKCPFGIFVMPDNSSKGSIEDILIKQAVLEYRILHEKAHTFIQVVKTTDGAIPLGSELTKSGKNEGKAILHAMTSVLKPGKTLQTSIADNKWVPEDASQFPLHFSPVVDFLRKQLAIES